MFINFIDFLPFFAQLCEKCVRKKLAFIAFTA